MIKIIYMKLHNCTIGMHLSDRLRVTYYFRQVTIIIIVGLKIVETTDVTLLSD